MPYPVLTGSECCAVWYDDQVWSNYFNLSSPEQAAIIYHKLSTDGADEKVRVESAGPGNAACRQSQRTTSLQLEPRELNRCAARTHVVRNKSRRHVMHSGGRPDDLE